MEVDMRIAALMLFLTVMTLTAADIETATLDNGLTIIMSPDDTSPVVTICIAVKTGATCQTPETNGLAHFYEHMFFKGNAALPDQTAYNQRMGALGIVRNGTTYPERVQYFFTLSSTRLVEGLQFMFDAISTPLFDMEEMERERLVIMNEYERGLTHPFNALSDAREAVIYADAPWRINGIGEPEVIQSAAPPAMYHFRETYYTPDNCALIIAGDIDPEETFRLVEEMFSPWEFGGLSNYDELPLLISIEKDTTVFVESPAGISYVSIVYEGPSISSEPGDSYPADVWGSYLSLMSREFYTDLVTNGPFLDVHGSYYTQRFSPSITFGGMIVDGRTDEALEMLRDEIEQLMNPDYYDDEGLHLAMDELRRHRILAEETSRDVAIESLPFWWVVAGDLDYYTTYQDSIDIVEKEDIMLFLDKWLLDSPSAVFIMAPTGEEEQS